MTDKKKQEYKLPEILKIYESHDFATQQKARFIYFMIIAVLAGMVVIVASSIYLQLIRTGFKELYLPVILIETGIMLMFGICLLLLVKGFYAISTHLMLSLGVLSVWLIMWIDKGHFLTRLDTIIIIVALLNMTPLFITKYKTSILAYISANILMLLIFMWSWSERMNLPIDAAIDYIVDSSIAIVFTGILGYNIFNINKKAINRATEEIKERMRSEEMLKENELFRSRVFDSSRIPIIVMDGLTFEFIDCNPAAVEMYRFRSREQTLMKTPKDVSAPTQYDGTPSDQKVKFFVQKALEEGIVIFEWLHQRPDGELWDAEVHLMSFETGTRKLFQFSLIDVTERKKAENLLRESEEKYRFLLENMNELVMMVDNDDKVLFVNKKFTEVLGYQLNEIIGKKGYEILLEPNDQSIIIEENRNRIQKKTNQYEIRLKAKNGHIIDFLVSGAPIIDNAGEIIGSIGTMIDITERKKAERALKESEELHIKLIEALPDILMQFDLDGNIIYGNEPLAEILGITPEMYHKTSRKARVFPEDLPVIEQAIHEILTSDKTHSPVIENRFVDAWGKIHWLSGKISKLNINGQIILQTVSRDITEKKEIEYALDKYRNQLELLVKERTEELAATNEELTSTNEELLEQKEELHTSLNRLNEAQNKLIQSEKMASLGVLSAGIAHEINNPLNFIQGGVTGMENYVNENLKEHSEKVDFYLKAIQIGVKRAAEIVTSLNHYSRQDDVPMEDCNIHDIVDNCLVMLNSRLKNKIQVMKTYSDQNHMVKGNEGKLHQAFLNILSNAEQAITDHGVIEIKTENLNNKLIVEISDSGQGIEESNLQKVFDPFFTTKSPGQGTGLGLSITYKIIQEHNGAIEIISYPEKGTKVIVKIPVK